MTIKTNETKDGIRIEDIENGNVITIQRNEILSTIKDMLEVYETL